jgi:GNAT superfamily N-acetyltransferase
VAALLAELGYAADEDTVRARLDLLLARQDYAVLVAELNDGVAGLGSVHVLPVLHTDGPVGFITALVVSRPARGGGVGRRLVRGLEDFARTQGCARVLVTTANHRADAHQFYERIDYEHTGRRYARTLPMPGEPGR